MHALLGVRQHGLRGGSLPVTKVASLALALALAALSAPARADDYDAAFTRAIAAKERALDSNDPASWQAALDLFTEADRIRATKESKYELGASAARLKQDDVAVEAYEAALAFGLEGAASDKARAFVSAHAPGMGRVGLVGPAGAEVWVAARWRGTLPLARPLVLFAGKRRIELRSGGDRDERELVVTAGAASSLDFTTTASPTPSPPAQPAPIGPGAPPPTTPPDRTLAWTLTLGGASLLVLGGASALIANSNVTSHRERLSDLCAVKNGSDGCATAKPGEKSAAQDEVDSIATWKAVRSAGFVGLGAGVVATGVGVLLLTKGSETKPARTSLALVPGFGAVGVKGSF